jgi:pyruvate,orthophosphate dikinase
VERARIERTPDLPELERTLERVHALQETNPMLGTRGCRLAILHPEICQMQVAAIIKAAVAYEQELEYMRGLIERTVQEQGGGDLELTIGTMIELPRACFLADRIAAHADFFSFGTNDLTQTALGFSRDDVEGKFLARYIDRKVLDRSPFETLDLPGVGQLVRMAAWLGRTARQDLQLGICGEHGGDPDSVDFFHHSGLDYVSCSPYRIPIARMAAAQAVASEDAAPL